MYWEFQCVRKVIEADWKIVRLVKFSESVTIRTGKLQNRDSTEW